VPVGAEAEADGSLLEVTEAGPPLVLAVSLDVEDESTEALVAVAEGFSLGEAEEG